MCFILLSTALLSSVLWGNFAEKLEYISLIGLIGNSWAWVLQILLLLLVICFIFLRKSNLKKSMWYSLSILLTCPIIIFCTVYFVFYASISDLRGIRNNVKEFFPLVLIHEHMSEEEVDNPIVVSHYNVFAKNVERNQVREVLKKLDQFNLDMEKFYGVNLNYPIYVIVTDHPYEDPNINMAATYGRNVIVMAKRYLFLEKGLIGLKHEIGHIYNEIYATKHQIEFPPFINELIAQRLRVLKGSDTPCILPNDFKKELDPYIYKRLLPVSYKELRKHYNNKMLLTFPDDDETSRERYSFLILVSCNLDVPLSRYLDWVKHSNNMSVGDAFKRTFGIEFEYFIEHPERIAARTTAK